MKTCSKCKEEKDESCFYVIKDRENKLRSNCRSCESTRAGIYAKEKRAKSVNYKTNKYISEYPLGSKERINEQKKRWYLANKEKAYDSVRRYRLENLDKLKDYYLKNREKLREWQLNNKDKKYIYAKKWRVKNSIKVNEYQKDYQNNNKDKVMLYTTKSYYKRVNGITLSAELLETIVLINKTKRLCRTLNN